MHFKEDLKKEIHSLNIQRKSIGKLFYVPFIFNYIVVPFFVSITFNKYGFEEELIYSTIITYSQYFTPIMAAWWIMFTFMELIEGDGNELYFMIDRIKLRDFGRLLFTYILSIVPPFMVYSYMFNSMILEFIRIMAQCSLFASLMYFLVFLFRSITAAMIPTIIYCFFSIFGIKGVSLRFLFYDDRFIQWEMINNNYLPMFIVSIIFTILGTLCNQRFKRYN